MYPTDKKLTKIGFGYWQMYPDSPFFVERKLAGRPHFGVDILPNDEFVTDGKLNIDFPIIATVTGKITACYLSESYGYIVKQSFETSTEPFREFRYAHMAKFYVRPGQEVKKGEIIGLMGNTGSSNWPHLHFEVRKIKNGRLVPINPAIYLT